MEPSRTIDRLIDIMAALRTPQTGCPWDLVQDFESIKPYTIEEAYEVADAIERHDMDDLCEELGDLLLQVVFHARMAEEAGQFSFGDVVHSITAKMIRRHPHVFAVSEVGDPHSVKLQWDEIKAQEKAERLARRRKKGLSDDTQNGLLDQVSSAQPSLSEALKLQSKAAKVGFDWSEASDILNKIEEETNELREALANGNPSAVNDELGDLIFALVNLGRHVDQDPEMAVRNTNLKFRRRFRHIETELASEGLRPSDVDLARMDALWNSAKAIERALKS